MGKGKRMETQAQGHTKVVRDAIAALALCHNVTSVVEGETITYPRFVLYIILFCEILFYILYFYFLFLKRYQASSPDEVAPVKFTESVGLVLAERTVTTITLRNPASQSEVYEVLNVFPFTSETKRVGIIVRDTVTRLIMFYMKGADTVMAKIVNANDWLDEGCGMSIWIYLLLFYFFCCVTIFLTRFPFQVTSCATVCAPSCSVDAG